MHPGVPRPWSRCTPAPRACAWLAASSAASRAPPRGVCRNLSCSQTQSEVPATSNHSQAHPIRSIMWFDAAAASAASAVAGGRQRPFVTLRTPAFSDLQLALCALGGFPQTFFRAAGCSACPERHRAPAAASEFWWRGVMLSMSACRNQARPRDRSHSRSTTDFAPVCLPQAAVPAAANSHHGGSALCGPRLSPETSRLS